MSTVPEPCVLFPFHPISRLVPHIHPHYSVPSLPPSLRLSLTLCFITESLRTEAAHGDSPEGIPKPDDVIEAPRGNSDGAPSRIDASGSAIGQDGEEGATVGGISGLGVELRDRAVATPSVEEEAGTGRVVAAGKGGDRSERRRKTPLTERKGFESIRKILPEGGDGLEMDVERLRSLRSEISKARCCSFVSAEMFVCRQLVRRKDGLPLECRDSSEPLSRGTVLLFVQLLPGPSFSNSRPRNDVRRVESILKYLLSLWP